MKFLADMGISPNATAYLAKQGYDAVHLIDQGLQRLPDPQILAKARHEQRVLITHDLGFGELVAASGARLPSVIIFRLRFMQPAYVNAYLQQIISGYHQSLADGCVLSVTEGQIRARRLPV